jgi:hypothetical protein
LRIAAGAQPEPKRITPASVVEGSLRRTRGKLVVFRFAFCALTPFFSLFVMIKSPKFVSWKLLFLLDNKVI